VSIHFDASRDRFVVRWKQDGRRRVRRFRSEADAIAFDASLLAPARRPPLAASVPTPAAGDGIYAYETRDGTRYRFLFRQSDGRMSSRRGFTSRRAATTARRKLVESIDRGEVVVYREDFETFWERLVVEKRAYLTPGAHLDLTAHGRKRLVPFFGEDPLSSIDGERVREWLAQMTELVEAGDLSPKTVNNARRYLSVAFNVAVRRGLLPRNPCDGVPALPLEQLEIDFLRLAEIEPYLDACADYYQALAEFLIGTGARVSEAVASRWTDLDLDAGVVRFYRQRARDSSATRATKGKRFSSVQIGPRLADTLRTLRLRRLFGDVDDSGWIILCP
jgi:integrase